MKYARTGGSDLRFYYALKGNIAAADCASPSNPHSPRSRSALEGKSDLTPTADDGGNEY